MQRQRDLQSGVDADLVAATQRRSNFGWKLLLAGAGILGLLWIISHFAHPRWLDNALLTLGLIAWLGGLAILKLSSQEKAFLNKPDPEEPPRLDR